LLLERRPNGDDGVNGLNLAVDARSLATKFADGSAAPADGEVVVEGGRAPASAGHNGDKPTQGALDRRRSGIGRHATVRGLERASPFGQRKTAIYDKVL
jgi:hypothetical protein